MAVFYLVDLLLETGMKFSENAYCAFAALYVIIIRDIKTAFAAFFERK